MIAIVLKLVFFGYFMIFLSFQNAVYVEKTL